MVAEVIETEDSMSKPNMENLIDKKVEEKIIQLAKKSLNNSNNNAKAKNDQGGKKGTNLAPPKKSNPKSPAGNRRRKGTAKRALDFNSPSPNKRKKVISPTGSSNKKKTQKGKSPNSNRKRGKDGPGGPHRNSNGAN